MPWAVKKPDHSLLTVSGENRKRRITVRECDTRQGTDQKWWGTRGWVLSQSVSAAAAELHSSGFQLWSVSKLTLSQWKHMRYVVALEMREVEHWARKACCVPTLPLLFIEWCPHASPVEGTSIGTRNTQHCLHTQHWSSFIGIQKNSAPTEV